MTSNIGHNLEGGEKKPFGYNRKRFDPDDNGVPGAGTYKLADSCVVKAPQVIMASYKSAIVRELDQVIGKNNPGIGEYDTQHLRTI